MKAVHIDAVTGKEIPAHEVMTVVSTGFVSWHRLLEMLRECGELRQREQIVSWQIDERGITYRVENR